MISSFISLNSYLLLNGAIAIAYLVGRIVLGCLFLQKSLLPSNRLQFLRYSFLMGVFLFIFAPYMMGFVPSSYHSNFQLGPILKSASMTFLPHQVLINDTFVRLGKTNISTSINTIFTMALLLGYCIYTVRYIKNIFVLKQIQKQSFCQHNIHGVHILFHNSVDIPFCWSGIKNHFIVIPQYFLEKNADLRLAVRHELQHIRQGDTRWSHFLALIQVICFWNPFVKLWIHWLDEQQEFSCDETIILRNKKSTTAYAQCLINAASTGIRKKSLPEMALGINGFSLSILQRRVSMLFNYHHTKTKRWAIVLAYIVSCCMSLSLAYALNGPSSMSPLSTKEVTAIIKKSDIPDDFQVFATPEVVSEINNIRGSDQARSFMQTSLKRMKQYQSLIQKELNQRTMPNDLLVVPLVESGYKPLDQSKNFIHAAGIWQFIPETAKHFGLVINANRDDRLDTELSTKAALACLQATHAQFGNWKLALVAYEIGEDNTSRLIKETGSHDAWVLARSSTAPESLKKFIAMLDAALIIMHNPSLIGDRG